MDLYNSQEHMKTVSQSDLRAQLEVIFNNINKLFNLTKCF